MASDERFTRRVRGALRREAHGLLQGGPPTTPVLRPVGPEVPTDAHVQEVLDLCMQVGEVLLASGESAADTTDTMLRIASALGLATVDVDITFTSITMCCHRGNIAVPVTSMGLIRHRVLDLTRLEHMARIVDKVQRGELDVRAAAEALDTAVRAPHPYPRWVATAGWGGLAASIAVLLGADPLTALVAFVVTAVIDRVGRILGRWGVPAFFQQVIGGILATGSTLALFAAGVFPSGTLPSLVVAACITVLLSGMSVVGSVQDAIAGYVVTSAGRATEVALLSAGLLTGVVLALKIGFAFGLALEVAEPLPVDIGRFGLAVLAAGTATAASALAGYSPLRALPMAALAGAAGWATYWATAPIPALGQTAATGIAATVVGAVAGLLRRRGGVQPLVVTLAGITPLLPGLVAYRGFYELAVEGVAEGLVTITVALGIGLALAAGVALGDFITRPRGAAKRVGSAEPEATT